MAEATLLVGLLSVAAAATAEQPITLPRALEIAAERSPELAAAEHRAAAAAAEADAAARASWPRLSLGAELWRSDNAARVFMGKLNRGAFGVEDFETTRLNDPDALTHATATATLEAPLDVFGKAREAARARRAAGRAARALGREAAQEVRLRVTEAYWQAALARGALEATGKAVSGARRREADLEARVAEGAALHAELLRARARRREREADLAARQGELGVALAALARAMGAGAVFVPAERPPAPDPIPGDDSPWLERALARRASIAAARERHAAAASRERAERRAALPDLGAYGQLQEDAWSGAGRFSTSVALGVRWGVLDPVRGRRVAAASAAAGAAEAEARAAEAQARFEVQAAFRRALAARERHAAAGGGAEEGREALRVVQERRRAGMATLTDELETEAASLAAELAELRAAAEAAIADAALRRAAGEL